MKIENSGLIVYANNEKKIYIPLSTTQQAIILKILGIKLAREGYCCYDDRSLLKIINVKGNPLHFVEK